MIELLRDAGGQALDRSRLPIWNPSEAASAGATFAGVLGALVVSVTFQIVLNADRGASDAGKEAPAREHRRLRSMMAAPVALALLLVAAYMYVVLSGTEQATQSAIQGCLGNMPPIASGVCDLSTIRVSAAMFALSGSYLGLGAIVLTFTLVLVVDEASSSAVRQCRGATLVLFWTSTIIAIVALLWGYRDAYDVFRPDVLESKTIESNSGIWRYVWHDWAGLVIVASLLAGIAAGSTIAWLAKHHNVTGKGRSGVIGIGVAYLVLPFIWFVVVQNTPRASILPGHVTGLSNSPPGAMWMTQAMLAWVGLAVGGMLTQIRPRQKIARDAPSAQPVIDPRERVRANRGLFLFLAGMLVGRRR